MAKSRTPASHDIPTVQVIRRPTGRLDYRPPGEGQAWRTGFADMAALGPAAMREVEPPFRVEFLAAEPEGAAPARKPRARQRD